MYVENKSNNMDEYLKNEAKKVLNKKFADLSVLVIEGTFNGDSINYQ